VNPVPASIPSPSNNTIALGPLTIHIYGIMLAIGVLVAAWMARRRWVAKGHPADEMTDLLFWTVLAGIVGARLYHVITDYQLFTHHLLRAVEIWRGGLGIWGAVAGGGIMLVILAGRRHLDVGDLVDSIAPALLVAQAIGRWGNYFNQELFGGPTNLPWGLQIDPAKRPVGYAQFATFHPTFLYESLYCLLAFVALLMIEKRVKLVKGQLFALYCAFYTAGRFVWEEMRIDPAHTIGPLRINAWMSLTVFTAAWVWFVWLARHGHRPGHQHAAPPANTPTGTDAVDEPHGSRPNEESPA
jgi:prolipoprotein diacylglyceryl transferase